MGSIEVERKSIGWTVRDPSGVLSPYAYTLRKPGPEDVYIKVICCGVCHTDIHQAKNDLGMSHYPMVPGHEVVGEVIEVGSDVSNFKVEECMCVGVIVGSCNNCHPCKSDIEQYCAKIIWSCNDVYTDGIPTQGGFASRMVVDQMLVDHYNRLFEGQFN